MKSQRYLLLKIAAAKAATISKSVSASAPPKSQEYTKLNGCIGDLYPFLNTTNAILIVPPGSSGENNENILSNSFHFEALVKELRIVVNAKRSIDV
jgi:hypothetical protein